MSRISPPKPWERPGSANPIRPASTPATGIPSIAASPASVATSTSLTTTNSSSSLPPRPWERGRGTGGTDYDTYSRSSYGGYGNYGGSNSYGSSYGSGYNSGYGSSSYGSSYGSGYGSSGYGGSGYGSSYGSSYGGGYGDYGSRYGSSSYGSGYGGYGSSGYGSGYGGYGSYGRGGYGGYGSGYGGGFGDVGGFGGFGGGPYDNKGGYSLLNTFQYFVESFARFSRLLDANFDAMHCSFSSIARLVHHMGHLNFEVMTAIKTFAVFRFFRAAVNRTLGVFSFLLPRSLAKASTPSLTSSSTTSTTDKDKNSLVVGNSQSSTSSTSTSTTTSDATASSTPQTPPNWRTIFVVFLVTFVGVPLAINKLISKLARKSPLELEWGKDGAVDRRGDTVEAQLDFVGESERELSFNRGDVLTITNYFHPDWWEATLNGRSGIIPASYVSPIDAEQLEDE